MERLVGLCIKHTKYSALFSEEQARLGMGGPEEGSQGPRERDRRQAGTQTFLMIPPLYETAKQEEGD